MSIEVKANERVVSENKQIWFFISKNIEFAVN